MVLATLFACQMVSDTRIFNLCRSSNCNEPVSFVTEFGIFNPPSENEKIGELRVLQFSF